MKVLAAALYALQLVAPCAAAASSTVEMLRRSIQARRSQALQRRDTDPTLLYPAHTLAVPIDHFYSESKYEPHLNGTFDLRYWFDATYYKKGGPVIVLASGEADGEERLPYLQKGIVYQLAKATGGLGIILEHRYYGQSFPVPDLSTQNLRYLTTEQALADTAYFAQHATFAGVEDDLTAPNVPWIIYGGSYAGAFAAFARVEYPDIFWGAISSSGVTEAIYDYWQYFEPIRKHGPQECVHTQQKLIHIVDSILLKKNESRIEELKEAFGLGGITHTQDFANQLTNGIYGWQSTNWDPEVSDPSFWYYCSNITTNDIVYPATYELQPQVEDYVRSAGYGSNQVLVARFLNFIGYVNLTTSSACPTNQDSCFDTFNSTQYQADDLSQDWRPWPYQYCTEWGYLQTGDTPPSIPPLLSRTIDLPYTSIICREAFGITTPSNVSNINKYGGFNIRYPRLAIIGGQADPWREATPLASTARPRRSTVDEPVILIPDAVHHWDENGLFPNETTPALPPKRIAAAQKAEREFVVQWVKEWNEQKKAT